MLVNDCIPTRVGNVVGGFQIVLDKFHGQPGMTCFGQNNVLPEHIVFSLDVNCVLQQGVVQGVGPQEGVVAQPQVICEGQQLKLVSPALLLLPSIDIKNNFLSTYSYWIAKRDPDSSRGRLAPGLPHNSPEVL